MSDASFPDAPVKPRPRAPRLSRVEQSMCLRLGLAEAQVKVILDTRPTALIVGESPGPTTQSDCPMFPYPKGSAASRLSELSALDIADYLAKFQRVNLLDEYPGKRWPLERACERAELLLRAMCVTAWPMVVCGQRAAEAFCLKDHPIGEWRYLQTLEHSPGGTSWFTWASSRLPGLVTPQPRVIRIPHPSAENVLKHRDLMVLALSTALVEPQAVGNATA